MVDKDLASALLSLSSFLYLLKWDFEQVESRHKKCTIICWEVLILLFQVVKNKKCSKV